MQPVSQHYAPIGQVDYASQQRKTLEIDRTGILTELQLHLQYTVTSAAGAISVPWYNTLSRIIRRLEVLVNGKDTLVSLPGEFLETLAKFDSSVAPFGADDSFVLTGSTTATTYNVVLPVRFDLPRSSNPLLCALPAERLGQVTLAITWANADISDLVGTPNSATGISAVTCEVEGRYLLGANDNATFMARVLDYDDETVSATSTNHQVTIDTGTGVRYRSLTLVQLRDYIAVDNVINDINFGSGTQVFQHRKPYFVRGDNRKTFQLDTVQTGVLRIGTEMYGNAAMWINSARDVLPADLRLTLDVTKTSGSEHIHVIKESIRPYKG